MGHFMWKPIQFDEKWNDVDTQKFDNIYPSWERRRLELNKNPGQYEEFINRLKRKQAIDTGIIERMYDLKKGVTETFIREGFVDSYLQHGDTNISPNLLMDYLKDNFEAIDFIFDFVKNNRELSVSYIKELHHLITNHQDSTDAIDQFGNKRKIPMLKGEFKTAPNNPVREDMKYCYCPPEQVESEMDNLIRIFNLLTDCHVIVKAAFLHHAFVQTHPFQDGNGRIARLLASFVLIKEGLFPLSIDRADRAKYIDALEKADSGEFQNIVSIFADNQIASIEVALNWKIVEDSLGYENVVSLLEQKISGYRKNEEENRRIEIAENMRQIFEIIQNAVEEYKTDLMSKLSGVDVDTMFCAPSEEASHYYAKQIISYANMYDYYVNLSLDKCWGRMFLEIDSRNKYRMVISLHHYGYDNSTFAIGAFLSKVIDKEETGRREYMDVPLGIPPLIMSSERNPGYLAGSVIQQVKLSIMATLAYITNELPM